MLALVFALWLSSLGPAQIAPRVIIEARAEIPRGQIVEKVVCAADSSQSYALYLPSNYSPEHPWPTLYAFDPAARGKLPLEHFREAAEKYGWILVGSNNSRNGPMKIAFDAGTAIWKDTHDRFAVDEQQTYFAGFSGGARVAVTVASSCHDCVAGVITCGAGFPAEIKPSSATRFVVFGTTGIDDFNFPELKQLGETLTKAGVTNQIEVFAGRHEWPPSSLAGEAIEWLNLLAIKRKARQRDSHFIEQVWEQKLRQARTAEESKQFYDAYRIYAGLVETFKGLHDVDDAEKRLNLLRATHEVKQAIADERAQIARQRELEREINDLINQGEQNNEDSNTGPRLSALLANLQKSARAENDTDERRVARRVTEGLFILLLEQGRELQNRRRYSDAVRKLVLATELAPDRPGVFITLASAYAQQGDKKKALQALKIAVARGFTDRAAIVNNQAFDSVRNEPEYLQVIGKLKTP
jgi:tetratricopeptide (TPR) repeat protein